MNAVRRTAMVVPALAIALVTLIAPQAAQADERKAPDRAKSTVVFRHGVATPTSTQGSGLGTVRFFSIPGTVDGKAGVPTFLNGTLTTIALDPAQNRDVRASNLILTVGGEENQLVFGGLSVYPADGSTLAPGTKTIRPILGGTGIYDGARGSVVSENLGAQGWTHIFRIKR